MNAAPASSPVVPRPWPRLLLLHTLPLFAAWPWGATGFTLAFGLIAAVMVRSMAFPHGWFFGRARRSFPEEGRRMLYLTIDDGPTDDTPALLDVLHRHRTQACFFLIGNRAAARPDLARAITQAGHQIGNHTQSHPAGTFWAMPPSGQRREIRRANDSIAISTGQRPCWFRAPVGLLGPFLPRLVHEEGLGLLGWNARGFDTRCRDPQRIVRAIMADLRPGGIILLHQGHPHSVATLEHLLVRCREEGWEFSPLPEAHTLDRLPDRVTENS